MRYVVCLLFIALSLTQCYISKHAQVYPSSKPKVIANQYASFVEEGETVLDYGYHYMITKNPLGIFIEREFYPEKNRMTSYCEYADRQLKVKEGAYQSWTDDGQLYSEGQHFNNNKEGSWKHYYFHATESGDYMENNKEGQWESIDTAGIKTVYTYVNNLKQGKYTSYNQHDIIIKTGEYIDGISQDQEIKNKEMPYLKEFEGITDKDEKMAKSQTKMLQQLYKNLKYPAIARENNVQGMAIIQFMVMADGSVGKTKVIKGICDPIANACLEAIQFIGPWSPGTENGKPVEVQYTLPIRFKLEG